MKKSTILKAVAMAVFMTPFCGCSEGKSSIATKLDQSLPPPPIGTGGGGGKKTNATNAGAPSKSEQ